MREKRTFLKLRDLLFVPLQTPGKPAQIGAGLGGVFQSRRDFLGRWADRHRRRHAGTNWQRLLSVQKDLVSNLPVGFRWVFARLGNFVAFFVDPLAIDLGYINGIMWAIKGFQKIFLAR